MTTTILLQAHSGPQEGGGLLAILAIIGTIWIVSRLWNPNHKDDDDEDQESN